MKAHQDSPEACSSEIQCADFLTAVKKVVAEAERLHVRLPADKEGLCDMPGNCGPLMWHILHGSAQAFNDHVCSSCGEAAIGMMSFFHDLVNRKLGKPLFDSKNFSYWLKIISELKAKPKDKTLTRKVKAMIHAQLNNLPQDHEVGASLCRTKSGQVLFGPWSEGSHDNVDVDLVCPFDSKLIGSFHTHPGGSPEPSQQDLEEAHRLHMEQFCIAVPETGEVVCKSLL